MKNPGSGRPAGKVTEFNAFAARVRARPETNGIEVREQELGAVSAQRLYKMRCSCGRSWFELQLPHLVACPACEKMGLVTL